MAHDVGCCSRDQVPRMPCTYDVITPQTAVRLRRQRCEDLPGAAEAGLDRGMEREGKWGIPMIDAISGSTSASAV